MAEVPDRNMRSYVQIPEDEVLDRLLELNHTRYADERRRGLQTEAKGQRRARMNSAKRQPLFE